MFQSFEMFSKFKIYQNVFIYKDHIFGSQSQVF